MTDLTQQETRMVLAGLVQLGMDSGLMWELDTDVEEVTRLTSKIREVQGVPA